MLRTPSKIQENDPPHLGTSVTGEQRGKDERLYMTSAASAIARSSIRAITKSNSSDSCIKGHTPQPAGPAHRDVWAHPSISHPNAFNMNGSLAETLPQNYHPTQYMAYEQPAYSKLSKQKPSGIRFIRPAPSPINHNAFAHQDLDCMGVAMDTPNSSAAPSSANELATQLAKGLSVATHPKWATAATNMPFADLEGEEDVEEDPSTHPNKYPVQIEYHETRHCCYKRQPTRSGLKIKQIRTTVYDPTTAESTNQMQEVKYYQRDLVRICCCGSYSQMEGALEHGRANDCDGYEIHYSQKCKWKAYDDYKTGKRVLIRLCKCYKELSMPTVVKF